MELEKTGIQEKYAFVDVWDAFVYNENDELLFMSKNLTSADIKGDSSETEIRNGKMNGLWDKLYFNKKVDVSLKTNLFSFSALALLSGSKIGTGDGTYYSESFFATVKDGQIELQEEPKYPQKVSIFIEDVKVTTSINGRIVTLDADYEGKKAEIMPYEYDSDDEDIQQIDIKADEFPESVKLVLKSYIKKKGSKVYKNLTIVIPQASVKSNFSMSSSSDVKPDEQEIQLSALTGGDNSLMKVYLTPFSKETVVQTLGNITWASTPIDVVAKDSTGVGDPPYQLFKVNYTRIGGITNTECIIKDKDTGEVYYKETGKTAEGNGSFIWSYRKGLENYDAMSQADKDAVERTNDTQLPKSTEVIIAINMTDTNGAVKTIAKNYVITAKDVTASKYTA